VTYTPKMNINILGLVSNGKHHSWGGHHLLHPAVLGDWGELSAGRLSRSLNSACWFYGRRIIQLCAFEAFTEKP
jgi:hypothetical protein